MGTEKYEHANCNLFRSPPVDTSRINKTLDKLLIEAWQSGCSAVALVKQILNDKKVSPRTQFKETIALGLSYTIF